MPAEIILASISLIRAELLTRAGVVFTALPARIDEVAIRDALLAEGAKPRDLADALAEFKARKIAEKRAEAVVIGCDQVLQLKGEAIAKAETVAQARTTLLRLRGAEHRLLSAVVVYEGGAPVWRVVREARLTMRDFSDAWLDGYLARNADAALTSVGAYRLEEEGVRLFSRVEGDYFTILGLPLVDLLMYLTSRNMIEG